jgi:hypothetical protein
MRRAVLSIRALADGLGLGLSSEWVIQSPPLGCGKDGKPQRRRAKDVALNGPQTALHQVKFPKISMDLRSDPQHTMLDEGGDQPNLLLVRQIPRKLAHVKGACTRDEFEGVPGWTTY